MMESEALIQQDLELAGVDLVFVAGTCKGISQQRISEVSDGGSPFAVVSNTYSFIMSMQDIKELSIEEGLIFTMQVFSRLFSFEVGSYTEDLTGWVELFATMTGVSDV
jgi:hypothetical protein